MYATGRRYPWPFQYQAAVPNLEYVVTLKFADYQYGSPGQRLFDVAINGNTVPSRVDMAGKAGGQYKPWDVSLPVYVTGGRIAIQLVPVVGEATINASGDRSMWRFNHELSDFARPPFAAHRLYD